MRFMLIVIGLTGALLVGVACGDGDGNGDAQPTATEVAVDTPAPTATEEEAESTDEPADGNSYESPDYGYSFSYPEDWEHIEEEATIQAETGGNAIDIQLFGEINPDTTELNGLGITVRQLNFAVSEDQIDAAFDELDTAFQQLVAQIDGTIVETGEGELAGMRARRYVIDFLYNVEVPTRSEYLIVFAGDLEYEVNCQAEEDRFDEVREGCQQIWDSFQITS